MGSGGLLSVDDIARDRGWSHQWAWRWLRRLEKRHGAKLVLQKRTLYIERSELARVIAFLPRAIDPKIARELRLIVERIEALEGRQNGLANELRALKNAIG